MEHTTLRRYYSWLFIIAALLLIVCLIINCFFIAPEADVYIYSYITRLYGLIGAQEYWYLHWSGRIIPTFVISFGEYFIRNIWAYQLVSLFIILFFYFTIYAIVKKCFVFVSKLERDFTVAAISLTITQMFASVPSSFYWLPASVTYTVPMIISVWSLFFIFSKKKITRIVGFILLLLLATFNEIIDLLLLGLFIYLIFINYQNKELRKKISLAFLITLSGTVLMFTAPGNFERKGFMQDPLNIFQLLFYSNKSLFLDVYHWLFGSPVLLFLLLLFLVPDAGIRINEKFKLIVFKNKALLYSFIYGALVLPYLLMYKLTGGYPPERIINIVSCVFLLSVVLVIAEWLSQNILTDKFVNNPAIKYAAVVATILILYGFNDYSKNISLIVTDATSGKGKTYFNEYREQLKQLAESKGDTAYVRKINTIAPSISFNVLNSDTSNYIHSQFCQYFNKKKIIVQ